MVPLKKKYNAPKIIKDECGCCGLSDNNWKYFSWTNVWLKGYETVMKKHI